MTTKIVYYLTLFFIKLVGKIVLLSIKNAVVGKE